MRVDPQRLRAELMAACTAAGLAPVAFVVWIVDRTRPAGATPVAYLHPGGEVRSDTVAVFRAVGAERAAAVRGRAHRLAVWRSLPGFPPPALGPILRHELEHARRWELSGSAFFGADERLRAAVGHAGYADLPTEREANAAAAAYAVATLTPAELDALRAVPDCANLFAEVSVPEDVVAATVDELAARGLPGPGRLAPGALRLERPEPLIEVV